MAANRYGRIYHSDHHYINLRFPSVNARREFAIEFRRYHEGHDHDGEVPRFEDTAASTIGNMEANRVHDAHSVSIDGYATYEIEDYHNPDRWNTYNRGRYRPPTCCVPPTISVNRTFIDSSTLTRHELSAIFMDMPEEDFENLLKSVEAEGFKDPIIRMIDEQVLDGWHRYRAAKELNLLRKLRFQQWKEKDEGDPAAFVYARNMERRHLTPSQRGQIVVSFNKRAGAGNPNLTSPNGEVKTREQLAKEANVGTSTIDRAVKVDDLGRGDEVIRGEKTQGEVITEETIKSLWEQINPAIKDWKQAREGVGHASKSMFIKATLRWEGLPSDTETDVKVLKELLNLLTTTDTNVLEELVRKQLDGKDLWGDASVGVETAEQEMDQQATEVTAESLWAQIAEEMPKWKARDAEIAHPSDSIADASESILIAALRQCDIGNDNEGLETVEELNTLLNRIETDDFPLIVAVRDLLKKQATEPSEDERKKVFSDEIKAYLPTWVANAPQLEPLHGNESKITPKLLLNAHWHMKHGRNRGGNSPLWADEMEEVLATMKSGDTAFMDKMRKVMQAVAPELFQKDAAQTAEEREANKQLANKQLANKQLKEKKQLIKSIWDKRLEVAKDYIDQDITLLTLVELEKGFAAYEGHQYCVEAFQSGMRRTSETSFNICLEKTLASDVSLETLEAEYKALSTYALDILQWKKQEWIQGLIAKNKAKAEAKAEPTTEAGVEPDMTALWDAFNKRLPKWKAKYAESGYKENDLIQASTEAELFDALRSYRHSERTGPVTAEEIQDVTDLMKRASYPYARHLRKILREKQIEADTSLDDLNLPAFDSFLGSLMHHVGYVKDTTHRDELCCAVFDALLGDASKEVDERAQLSILLECARSILKEYETLDNEVLCEDDEADRQAMNSDLVSSAE